jgi:high-affinity nickel-transport protein
MSTLDCQPISPCLATTRSRILTVLGLLVLANLLIWAATFAVFHHFPNVLKGIAFVAFNLGLAHALDADHISAIDSVTRKLMQEGQRPVGVGFFFSLGHSTIVILLTLAVAITATEVQQHFARLSDIGGTVGTVISALFLLIVAGINLLVLHGVVRTFRKVRRGEQYDEPDIDTMLSGMGRIGRVVRPLFRMVDRSWKMYGVGFLFGLGFDTATQIGLLAVAATAAAQGMSIWSIMLFPALFTGGMCLVDTLDGMLMLGAYGWAYVHPVRKLYYNMTITAVSVIIAVVVGGIELLGIIGDKYDLHGWLWDAVAYLSDDNHFKKIGEIIIAIFVLSWIVSALGYRLMGYHELEAPATTEDGA